MDMCSQAILKNFYSLQGFRIQDRYKNFFILLTDLKRATVSDTILDEVISGLNPRNRLEELFKLQFLLYFRRTNNLLEVLKNENPDLIRLIPKHKWFIDEAFKDIDGYQLVEDIFPHFSFTTRTKIISRLAKCLRNEQKAQDYFISVNNKYGFDSAVKLLTACNVEFIRSQMLEYQINFEAAQLLAIAKRNPNFVADYLEELSKNRRKNSLPTTNYDSTYHYLSRNDPIKFLTLMKRYGVNLRFGRHTTKKIINSEKSRVIIESLWFAELLRPSVLVRALKTDFRQFYLNLFPEKISELSSRCNNVYSCIFTLLRFLPLKMRQSVLLDSFFTTYNSNLWDNKGLITESLFEILDSEKRDVCVTAKITDGFNENFICYYTTKKSIPILKERLNVASDVNYRSKLIEYMLKTCAVNKDYVALQDFCKYFAERHKNDLQMVRVSFLNRLHFLFDLAKLNEECWLLITELLDRAKINKEIFIKQPFYLSKCLEYKFINGLPVEDFIKALLIETVEECKWDSFYDFSKRMSVFANKFLVMVGKLIPSLFENDRLVSAQLLFLMALVKFNKSHKNEEICLLLYPELISNFIHAASSINLIFSNVQTKNIFKYFICSSKNVYQNEMVNLYVEVGVYFEESITLWLIHNEPQIVLENLELLLDAIPASYYKEHENKHFCQKFFNAIRNYAHTPLLESTVRYFVDIIKSKEYTDKQLSLVALSYLLEGQEFLNLIRPLFPDIYKIDATSDKHFSNKTMINCLKKVVPPSLAISSVLFFARGDYLQLTLSSLYSLSYHIPEIKIGSLLNELCERAVSVRKHGLKLTCDMRPLSTATEVLTKFTQNEKNVSVHLFIYRNAFRLFLRNPVDYIFELLKISTQNLVSHADELDSVVDNMKYIPDKYKASLVEIVWDVTEVLDEKGIDTWRYRVRMLAYFDEHNFTFLNETFIIKLISTYFLEETDEYNNLNINEFTCLYLYYYTNIDLALRINLVANKLITHASISKGSTIAILCEICKNCCFNNRRGILERFAFLWSDVLKPYENFFDQYLIFQMCLCLLETPIDDFLNKIGYKIGQYCNMIIETYGTAVTDIVCKALSAFVYKYLPNEPNDKNNEYVYVFLKSMLENNLSVHSAILCIYVLPKCVPEEDHINEHLNNIMNIMKDLNDVGINVLLSFNNF